MNRRGTGIYHFAGARVLILAFGLGVGGSFVTGEARASKDDKLTEQAWACSTLYSRYPIKVSNGEDNETALCLGEGKKGRKPMSRSEAYELCRDQFDATTLFIRWTSKGWNCRYYGR